MAAIADATILFALGRVGKIYLLERYASEVWICSDVYEETARYRTQLDQAIAAGWMKVIEAHAPTVAVIIGETRSFEMGRGEAGTIAVAVRVPGHHTLLIDEDDTYVYLTRDLLRRSNQLPWNVEYLGLVLHALEARQFIRSAQAEMQAILATGIYGWGEQVRADYIAWCDEKGKVPLPK